MPAALDTHRDFTAFDRRQEDAQDDARRGNVSGGAGLHGTGPFATTSPQGVPGGGAVRDPLLDKLQLAGGVLQLALSAGKAAQSTLPLLSGLGKAWADKQHVDPAVLGEIGQAAWPDIKAFLKQLSSVVRMSQGMIHDKWLDPVYQEKRAAKEALKLGKAQEKTLQARAVGNIRAASGTFATQITR